MGTIIPKKQGNSTYYVYYETHREKINPEDSGKTRGTGKSKVRTRSIHLGSAEKILNSLQQKRKPIRVQTRHFGLIAAAYQTSYEIELPQIFMKHLQGVRCGVPLWIYFFVTIINRLDHATSKNKMYEWLKKTILPELMRFDPKKLTGKNFWYAANDVLSENELRKRRKNGDGDEVFAGIDDAVFNAMETELFSRIDQLIGLSPEVICYDTTNFFTYIDEPKCSELANTCHSKDSKHNLKHVGLLMAVEKTYGIPLVSRVYRANVHDSKVFSFILADIIIALKQLCGSDSNLVLILDKGNNSQENFVKMSGKISWVGSLVPSHYEDLIKLELTEYQGHWKDRQYYRCKRMVMGTECVIVLTFSPATKRRQEYSLRRGIEKLKKEIIGKWKSYKKTPKTITSGIKTMKKKSHYGECLKISARKGNLHFEENKKVIEERMKRFGKNLIFSNMVTAETGYLIDTYNEKNIVENDFHLLKDTEIIRFRPIRHWTDSKIRAYAFCCVISMTLMRVMQWKTEQAGYRMSPNVIKEELTDLQEVVMVYSSTEAERKITERSTVQGILWNLFRMEEIESKLTIH